MFRFSLIIFTLLLGLSHAQVIQVSYVKEHDLKNLATVLEENYKIPKSLITYKKTNSCKDTKKNGIAHFCLDVKGGFRILYVDQKKMRRSFKIFSQI